MNARACILASLFVTSAAACSRTDRAHHAESSVAIQASAAPAASIAPSSAKVDAGPQHLSRYPIGRDCEKPEALTAEKRSLPRAGAWTAVTSPHQRISLRVPPGVFKVSDNARRLLLTGSDATPSMATGGDPRPFSIAVQRVAKGADVIASDPQRTKLLLGPFYDLAYELRGDDSPLPPIDENEVQGWSGARVDLLGHTAYVAVNGIEGDNSDYVVVPISDKDTLLVTADWSSTFNFGQPMCFERRIIAGVIESIAPKGP